jgi:hypothetical protein
MLSMVFIYHLAGDVQAQTKAKGLPVATPEQAVEFNKMKEKDLMSFFLVTADKEKAEMEKFKIKFKQRIAAISKAGKQLTPAEKAEVELLNGDVKMLEAGLNPIKMTKDERVKVMSLLDASSAAKTESKDNKNKKK